MRGARDHPRHTHDGKGFGHESPPGEQLPEGASESPAERGSDEQGWREDASRPPDAQRQARDRQLREGEPQ